MHVISQSCVLFLWINVLISVKCKDCTLEEFKTGRHFDKNLETSALDPSYPPGSSVRVPCKVGYTGYFRILCVEESWTPSSGNKQCEPKPCGHPGDAQFARFSLVEGEDFVFGSEVVYKCNKGYQMITRSNRRRCLANGWDGIVPVCEAQTCPTIHVDNNVQVHGDTDGATYSSLVRFSCTSRDEILSGPDEITCDETGKWSDKPPTCKAISCDAPAGIDHGRVSGNRKEYKENEVLNFVCDEGYTRADKRPSKCTQVVAQADWIPTPACREIKCELLLSTAGTTYRPSFQNVFSPRETVRVTCGEKYWILNTQTTEAEITCKEDGEWATQPVCHEVRCPDPTEDQKVYNWRPTETQRRLGGKYNYQCRWNYYKPQGTTEAECTRDGWTPKPLCAGSKCYRQVIDNADFIENDKSSYTNGETVRYRCSKGDRETFTLTCNHGRWSGIRTCPGVIACKKPQIENGFAVGPFDDTLYYSCDEGYKPYATNAWWGVVTCEGSEWSETPRCIENTICGEAPNILNGKLTPRSGNSQILEIVCDVGYNSKPSVTTVACRNGKWDATGDSLKTMCTATQTECTKPPKVENAVIDGLFQKKYLSGSRLTYLCRDKYMTREAKTITCTAGEWGTTTIRCERFCEKLQDDKFTIEPPSAKEKFLNGEKLTYKCKTGAKEGTATCTDGNWDKTVECDGLTGCSNPPYLENGDFLGSKSQYEHDERVEYSCQAYYIMEGDRFRTCQNGIWSGKMRCLKPCTVNQYDLDEKNIYFLKSELKKLYAEHGDHITFICKEGCERADDVAMRQRCNDGVMALPACRRRRQ